MSRVHYSACTWFQWFYVTLSILLQKYYRIIYQEYAVYSGRATMLCIIRWAKMVTVVHTETPTLYKFFWICKITWRKWKASKCTLYSEVKSFEVQANFKKDDRTLQSRFGTLRMDARESQIWRICAARSADNDSGDRPKIAYYSTFGFLSTKQY